MVSFFTLIYVAFVCVSAWLWRREALRHYRLQFWSQRRRKAASLQGPPETQPDRDVKTFSTRRRFIALYFFLTGVWSQTKWPVMAFWMSRTRLELFKKKQSEQWRFFEKKKKSKTFIKKKKKKKKVKFQSGGAAGITDSAGGDGCLPVTGLPLRKLWVFPSRLTASYCMYMLKPLRRSFFIFFSHMDNNITICSLCSCLVSLHRRWKSKKLQVRKKKLPDIKEKQ